MHKGRCPVLGHCLLVFFTGSSGPKLSTTRRCPFFFGIFGTIRTGVAYRPRGSDGVIIFRDGRVASYVKSGSVILTSESLTHEIAPEGLNDDPVYLQSVR